MLLCCIIPPMFMSRSGNAARSAPLPPACEERTPRAGSGAALTLPTAASMEPARKPLVAVTRGDFDESARRVGGWGIPVRAIPRPRNAADRQKNPRPLGGGIFRAGVRSPRGGQTAEGMPVRVSACPNAKTAAITAIRGFRTGSLHAGMLPPSERAGQKADPAARRGGLAARADLPTQPPTSEIHRGAPFRKSLDASRTNRASRARRAAPENACPAKGRIAAPNLSAVEKGSPHRVSNRGNLPPRLRVEFAGPWKMWTKIPRREKWSCFLDRARTYFET